MFYFLVLIVILMKMERSTGPCSSAMTFFFIDDSLFFNCKFYFRRKLYVNAQWFFRTAWRRPPLKRRITCHFHFYFWRISLYWFISSFHKTTTTTCQRHFKSHKNSAGSNRQNQGPGIWKLNRNQLKYFNCWRFFHCLVYSWRFIQSSVLLG